MCDRHRLQWRNLYHQHLYQLYQPTWEYQQHVQTTWEFELQYPFANPVALHFANNGLCHRSAFAPPSLYANENLCHCCSARVLPSRTCCIYANKRPYRCCTNGPLPVNTGCGSSLRCYPNRYPVMIEPHVPTRYARGVKNAGKYESSSEDEDDEDSSDDSSDEAEDDSSSDSDSNRGTPRLSKNKQPKLKKNAEMMKKQYKRVGSDNVSGNAVRIFSKSEQDFIKKKAEQLLKQYKGEEYTEVEGGDQSFALYEQVLMKINEGLMEEEKDKDEGIHFKIYDEPSDKLRWDDSDDEDASDEDADDESAADDDDTGEEGSSDEDENEKDPSGENEGAPDIKPEEHAKPPKYRLHLELDAYGEMHHRMGRMTPTPREDSLLEKELGEFVYGDKADAICGQETLMKSQFDHFADLTAPVLWPIHPIDP